MKKSVKGKNTSNKPNRSQWVDLHPHSYKHIAAGDPWVTADTFTAKFAGRKGLLYSRHQGNEYTFIADPKHEKIKARLWSREVVTEQRFSWSLKDRLKTAISRRENIKNRDNFYLVFAEADFLPGLSVLWLKEGFLIQSYCSFWKLKQKELVTVLRELVGEYIETPLKWVLWQDRDEKRENNFKPLWGKVPTKLILEEFNLKYLLHFDETYDIGLYTDMSAQREQFRDLFKGKKVLNLYAYTGAWSVFALSQGAEHVTSVDLSAKYIDWLERNLRNNELTEHTSITDDVQKALRNLAKSGEKFDVIICDPPTFSSDGKTNAKAFDTYPTLIKLMNDVMSENGKMVCYLNTHNITRSRFKDRMKKQAEKFNFAIHKELKLHGDCPTLAAFNWGDYLKGIIFTRMNK